MRTMRPGRPCARAAGEGRRARRGRVVVVLDVPMEECPACGERWLDWDVARRLDAILAAMLAGDAEIATRHYDEAETAAGAAGSAVG